MPTQSRMMIDSTAKLADCVVQEALSGCKTFPEVSFICKLHSISHLHGGYTVLLVKGARADDPWLIIEVPPQFVPNQLLQHFSARRVQHDADGNSVATWIMINFTGATWINSSATGKPLTLRITHPCEMKPVRRTTQPPTVSRNDERSPITTIHPSGVHSGYLNGRMIAYISNNEEIVVVIPLEKKCFTLNITEANLLQQGSTRSFGQPVGSIMVLDAVGIHFSVPKDKSAVANGVVCQRYTVSEHDCSYFFTVTESEKNFELAEIDPDVSAAEGFIRQLATDEATHADQVNSEPFSFEMVRDLQAKNEASGTKQKGPLVTIKARITEKKTLFKKNGSPYDVYIGTIEGRPVEIRDWHNPGCPSPNIRTTDDRTKHYIIAKIRLTGTFDGRTQFDVSPLTSAREAITPVALPTPRHVSTMDEIIVDDVEVVDNWDDAVDLPATTTAAPINVDDVDDDVVRFDDAHSSAARDDSNRRQIDTTVNRTTARDVFRPRSTTAAQPIDITRPLRPPVAALGEPTTAGGAGDEVATIELQLRAQNEENRLLHARLTSLEARLSNGDRGGDFDTRSEGQASHRPVETVPRPLQQRTTPAVFARPCTPDVEEVQSARAGTPYAPAATVHVWRSPARELITSRPPTPTDDRSPEKRKRGEEPEAGIQSFIDEMDEEYRERETLEEVGKKLSKDDGAFAAEVSAQIVGVAKTPAKDSNQVSNRQVADTPTTTKPAVQVTPGNTSVVSAATTTTAVVQLHNTEEILDTTKANAGSVTNFLNNFKPTPLFDEED